MSRFSIAAAFVALIGAHAADAQTRRVPLQGSKSVAITVNTGTLTLRSHAEADVVVRSLRSGDGIDHIAVKRERATLQLTANEIDARSADPAVEILVPANVPIRFAGRTATVRADGVNGPLDIQISRGEATVANHRGSLSINGSVSRLTVRSVTGAVRLAGTAAPIAVDSLVGSLVVTTVAGDITLTRIHAPSVEASSQSGSIHLDGAAQSGGSYQLQTLQGNVTWVAPPGADATVSLGTVHGTVNGAPASTSAGNGSLQTMVLGAGSAQVKLLSFKGNVAVTRR